jgi:hypothetical protein
MRKKIPVNMSVCNHIEDDSESICGALAALKVPMPMGIPDMPVCSRHYREKYSEWSRKDSNSLLVGLILEVEE